MATMSITYTDATAKPRKILDAWLKQETLAAGVKHLVVYLL